MASEPYERRLGATGEYLRCRECPAETRTERGMRLHLAVAHGIRYYAPLTNAPVNPGEDLPSGIRNGHTHDGR
jgi:hypothetical protein